MGTKHKRTQIVSLVAFAAGSALAGTACYDAAEYIYGESLDGLVLEVRDERAGIHPNQSVLSDPNNPFASSAPRGDVKWDIETYSGNVAAFYGWATMLAIEPTGEHQFYVAQSLGDIYANGEAIQEDLDTVLEMAIAGYQSVLDNFPDAVSFDSTGTFSFELVTPAYLAILDLGGVPEGDWVLVTGPNDQLVVVQR